MHAAKRPLGNVVAQSPPSKKKSDASESHSSVGSSALAPPDGDDANGDPSPEGGEDEGVSNEEGEEEE
eukprot:1136225-Prorocentrum_minimum.AAC.1